MIAITDGSIGVIADWHLAVVLAMDRASIGVLISLLPARDFALFEGHKSQRGLFDFQSRPESRPARSSATTMFMH